MLTEAPERTQAHGASGAAVAAGLHAAAVTTRSAPSRLPAHRWRSAGPAGANGAVGRGPGPSGARGAARAAQIRGTAEGAAAPSRADYPIIGERSRAKDLESGGLHRHAAVHGDVCAEDRFVQSIGVAARHDAEHGQ